MISYKVMTVATASYTESGQKRLLNRSVAINFNAFFFQKHKNCCEKSIIDIFMKHGDPTDMRESTSVFQIRTINWSKLDK